MTSVSMTGSSDVLEKVHVYRGAKHLFLHWRYTRLHILLYEADLLAPAVGEEYIPSGAIAVTDADAAIAVLRLNGIAVIVHE